jgi:hypothetical protein
MNMTKKIALIGAVLATLPFSGFAQDTTATPGIDKRQQAQQKRIDQGVQSGKLNPQEAARLQRRQDRIGEMEQKAKADGTVTKAERARIHQAQDRENRRIHRQKHDRQRVK